VRDDRYFPYNAIAAVENDRVRLTMDAETAKLLEWKKRPDYEHHLGDPLQLFYDRGYVVHDPFDVANPDQTWYISTEVCNTCNTCISCISCISCVRCSIAFPRVE